MTIFTQPSDNHRQRLLLEQVAFRLPELQAGARYPLAAILGRDFWDDVDEPHTTLGRCFNDLVEKGRVPFEHARWTKQRHNRYRYTGWDYVAPGTRRPGTMSLPNKFPTGEKK